MDVQVRAHKVLDKCEAMSLLCSKAANYWNIVKTAFQIPLILINSLLCIMNSLGQEGGMNMKMPNIIINGISVLLLSFQSNFKVPEKVELYKNLGNQFLLIAHSIEALDEEDFTKEQITSIVEKYDILLQQCKFEDIPGYIKKEVCLTFKNRTLPIQLNVTGEIKKTPVITSSSIISDVPLTQLNNQGI